MDLRDRIHRLKDKLQRWGLRSRSNSRTSSPAPSIQSATSAPPTSTRPPGPATSPQSASSVPTPARPPITTVASSPPIISPIPCNLPTSSQSAPNLHVTSPTPPPASLKKTLWEEAVDKLRPEDRKDFSLDASDKLNTLEEVIKATKEKRDECKEKQWKYTSYLDNLLVQLNKFVAIGNLAIQFSPSIVAMPWAGFRFLLQIRLNDTEIMGNVLLALEYITHTMNRCAIYENLYVKPLSQLQSALNLAACLPDLYAAILTYLCESKQFFTQKTPVRVLNSTWDPYISRFKPLMENIKEQEFTVESNARTAAEEYQFTRAERSDLIQQEQTQKLQEILTTIQMPTVQKQLLELHARIEKNAQDTDRQAILKWLSEVTFEEHHNFIKSMRHQGSGEWLLQKWEFIDWKESAVSSILWLHGIAGAGKTNLASAVVDKFQSNPRVGNSVAYFYCRYDQEDRRDPACILRALVKQLSTMEPGSKLPESVTKIYNSRKDGGFKSNLLMVEESKGLLVKLVEDFELTVIIIDALDECNKATRDELLDALKDILRLSKRIVKIFVTSRDDQDIVLHFDGLPNVYIRSTDNSNDIKRFIRDEIGSLVSRKKILNGMVDAQLEKRIISTITGRTGGMFLWAHMQIQSLLQEKTRPDLEKALTEMPTGLEETFSVILRRIDDQPERSRCRAKKALKFILGAQRPLSSRELIEALSAEPTVESFDVIDGLTKNVILDECQNFVVIDEKLDVFRFAHLSVNDFLKRHFSESEIHTNIAEVCLLSFFWCDWKVPFVNYARKYWAMHVRRSGNGGNAPLIDLQKRLFRPGPVFSEFIRNGKYSVRLKKYSSSVLTQFDVTCLYGLEDICQYLLNTGHNLSPKNNLPLIFAAEKGHEGVVKLLLGRDGIEVNCKDDDGRTPLLHASKEGHEGVVKLLLGRDDIEVNCKGDDGWTPLLHASAKGHEGVVKLLLGRDDIEANCKDHDGWTPLRQASAKGHEGVVKLLLGRDNIEANCKDDYGWTPLLHASAKGHEGVVKLLLGRDDIEVNCKQNGGWTPLLLASRSGHEGVVKLLLWRDDIEVNCKSNHRSTPLLHASTEGHEGLVKLLLGRDDIDVNCKGDYGWTPLLHASRSGHEGLVKLLLGRDDIEVNCKDDDGWTPLLRASRSGHEGLVKLLLGRHDVDVHIKGPDGNTALDISMKEKFPVIEGLLKVSAALSKNDTESV